MCPVLLALPLSPASGSLTVLVVQAGKRFLSTTAHLRPFSRNVRGERRLSFQGCSQELSELLQLVPRGWPGGIGTPKGGMGDSSARAPHSSCTQSSSVLYAILDKILLGGK